MSVTVSGPQTLAELWEQLGRVPLERIRIQPVPGLATTDDVLRLCQGDPKVLCELVDGVLVEKPMGHLESRLAAWLIVLLGRYLDENDVGVVSGADGPHRLKSGVVRLPDVAFTGYDRIPEGVRPDLPIPDWVPNLAVEIISPANTHAETRRKLQEYFEAGVETVWIVQPSTRSVIVFHALDQSTLISEHEHLDGGAVLPGFRLSVAEWFQRAMKISP
jgi:Uma2 family endonuclease